MLGRRIQRIRENQSISLVTIEPIPKSGAFKGSEPFDELLDFGKPSLVIVVDYAVLLHLGYTTIELARPRHA